MSGTYYDQQEANYQAIDTYLAEKRAKSATTPSKAEEALDSLVRNGSGLGGGDRNYFERAAISKDGEAVIVKFTPEQVARFVDMIFEEED